MRFLKLFGRRHRNDRGAAAVEMALTAPILMIIIIGASNYGVMAYQQSDLVAAARAAAEFVRVNKTATAADIPSSAVSLPPGAVITNVTQLCSCFNYTTGAFSAGSASGPTAGTCNTCASGFNQFKYVQVTAAIDSYAPFLSSGNLSGNFFGLGKFILPAQLSATTTLRAD